MSLEREVFFIKYIFLKVQLLKYLQNTPQIPKLLWNGEEGGNNVMILQLLGKDLTHYLKIYKKFSLKCVLNIAE
jgi:casein kinase 1